MKTAEIIIKNEVECLINGLDPLVIQILYDKFSIFQNGAQYSSKFKLRLWDGKIHFFYKNCTTYIQLLADIIPILKEHKYKIKLVDHRKLWTIDIPKIEKDSFNQYKNQDNKPLELAKHQVEAINAILDVNVGMICAAPGAGKSFIIAVLCNLFKKHANFKCIVIVPTTDLVVQTKADIEMLGNDIGEYSGSLKDINHDHVISTWQALQNFKELVNTFQVIIVDEAHQAKADQLKSILTETAVNTPIKIGMTGTLPLDPLDLMQIRVSLGNVQYTVTSRHLIDIGWLAELNLHLVTLVEDVKKEWEQFLEEQTDPKKKLTYDKFKKEFLPDYKAEKKYIQNKHDRIYFIGKFISKKVDESGNGLVLVNGIDYGRKLQKKIPNSYFLYGKDDREVRKEIYNLFSTKNNITVIASFKLAAVGLNIKRIFNLFLVDADKSFIPNIQGLNRGLRKAHDKDELYAYDIHSDLFYSSKHVKERKKAYNKEQYPFKEVKIDYKNLDNFS